MAWPLLQHPRSLPDGQPYPWPVLDGFSEDVTRLVEIAAGVQHAIDLAAVFRPLLDLVEAAVVRAEWVVGLLLGQSFITAGSSVSSARNP